MMKKLTVGQRIVAGFATLVVIFAALGMFALSQLQTISRLATVTTADCLQGIESVGRIESAVHENNILLVKYLMTKNEDLRAGFQGQIETNLQQIAGHAGDYQKTQHTPAGQQSFTAFDSERQNYASALVQVLKLTADGNTQGAMELKQSQVDKFLKVVQVEGEENKKSGDAAVNQVQHTASTTRISIIVGFVAMLIVAVGVSFAIVLGTSRVLKDIASHLGEGADQITNAAGQVSSASQSLAEGASQQAASLEETSSSLEEMASMTNRNAENTHKANELAKQTRDAAELGVRDMKEMSTAMEAIKSSSDDIAKIIKTIDEIAFQTNILALNAAVEAARAGEAGMGFAVVADEVRNLAQRSAQAAKETSAKIEGAISKTAQGVEISGKVAKSLGEIVTRARQVDELASQVAGASREQSQGISQLNTAVGQMDKVTQDNAASAAESASAAGQLKAQAENMKDAVNDLLRLVGGQSEAATGQESRTHHQPHAARTMPVAIAKPHASNGNGNRSNGNGAGKAAPRTIRHVEIPMAGDLNNF